MATSTTTDAAAAGAFTRRRVVRLNRALDALKELEVEVTRLSWNLGVDDNTEHRAFNYGRVVSELSTARDTLANAMIAAEVYLNLPRMRD